ncbi:putative TauD/TfdA-like domain-containing protein [Seiridium cardinale]
MAPSATTTSTLTKPEGLSQALQTPGHLGSYRELAVPPKDYNDEAEKGKNGHTAAKYQHYLPTWNPQQKYPPLLPFEYYEHGKDADPSFPDLLPKGVTTNHLTPLTGTEVRGIQISTLSNAGKDQLARYVAERKVVVFRDQDFRDLPIQDALNYGAYFGRHLIHPAAGSPEGYPEMYLVHFGEDDKSAKKYFETRLSSIAWHSDVSYEEQPPGITFLYILDKPETGGDTLFTNSVEAYNRLSPLFKERLHGLKAIHSGFEQAGAALARGGILRREPVASEHPIVRTHPATGEKGLFINPQFVRGIVGMKKEESEGILKILYDHMAFGADFQVRLGWEEGTVIVWDNRVTQHSGMIDWESGQRRHLARITPQGERPFETPYEA